MKRKRAAVILAAGKGKRMKSDLPKVVHTINGKPLVAILLDTVIEEGFDRIVVVIGHKGELVQDALSDYPVEFAWQHDQRGTGDAVKCAHTQLGDFEGITFIAAGDVPFLSCESIDNLFDCHVATGAAATCLSAVLDNPDGYGRIIRDDKSDRLRAIVEHKDATDAELSIKEINTGTFCFENKYLFEALDEVDDSNAQGEYYLTDAIKILDRRGLRVSVVQAQNPDEVLGVNSPEDLARIAAIFGDSGH